MYTNDELISLLEDAKMGGDVEKNALDLAIYDMLTRIVYKDKFLCRIADKCFGSIKEAIHDSFDVVRSNFIRNYNRKQAQPTTYISKGFYYHMTPILRKINKNQDIDIDINECGMIAYELIEGESTIEQIIDIEHDGYLKEKMWEGIRTLTIKEQTALEGYMNNETLRETADAMDVSYEMVRQYRLSALNKLRHILRNEIAEQVFE